MYAFIDWQLFYTFCEKNRERLIKQGTSQMYEDFLRVVGTTDLVNSPRTPNYWPVPKSSGLCIKVNSINKVVSK